jgi:hypothetical protein
MFSGGAYQGYGNAGNTMQNASNSYQNMISPYISAGSNALGPYQSIINQMSNPGQYISQLMQGYTMTPQAQYALQQGERAANAGGAATGMAGSGAEQRELQRLGQNITQQDQQQYLQNRLGVLQQSLGGMNNLIGMGEKGANKFGSTEAKMADAMAQNQIGESEAQQGGKNNAIDTGFNAIGNMPGLSEVFGNNSFFS